MLERLGAGLVGEVVGADGESVLGVVGVAAEVVAANETYCGDFVLCGEGEDVGCIEKEVLAEVSCGRGFFAKVVVADEEEGGLGVVGDVADDAAEFCGDADAAKWHEMVDVVDNNECGIEIVDEGFDLAGDGKAISSLLAEDVKADEMEVLLVDGLRNEFTIDACANVWAVQGVDPKDLTFGIGISKGGAGGDFVAI